MNLAIDVGNTLAKLALFEGEEIRFVKSYETLDEQIADSIFKNFPGIRSVIIGSVRELPEAFTASFRKNAKTLVLSPGMPLPVRLDYETPLTLGADRIAAVVAGNRLYPGKNTLVIEAGTCITYDLVDASGTYRGGSISPGLDMRFKALNTFTGKLPLIKAVRDTALTGKSTETSIQSGVINGMLAEIRGIIREYEVIYENLTVILSGGYLDHFDKILKNNIFAVPNIVLKGLNIILEFNEAKDTR